jgi:hypothetical protein
VAVIGFLGAISVFSLFFRTYGKITRKQSIDMFVRRERSPKGNSSQTGGLRTYGICWKESNLPLKNHFWLLFLMIVTTAEVVME